MPSSRMSNDINSGSMADIAFLLLIFFLVTTTIANDKGLILRLPPDNPDQEEIDIKFQQRNIFKILVNSSDRVSVEDEPLEDITQLQDMVKEFILNFGAPDEEAVTTYNSLPPSLKSTVKRSEESSDHPGKAVVSLKTDRGTSYDIYIQVLDQLQGAYYEIYGERVGLTADEFRALDQKKPSEKDLYDQGRAGIPLAISIAEPSNIGGN